MILLSCLVYQDGVNGDTCIHDHMVTIAVRAMLGNERSNG